MCGGLILLASCAKAPAPTSPPPPAPPPAPDIRKATYELQEKCARDARDWYKHWWEDVPNAVGTQSVSKYTNHYSAKLGRCFIVVDSTTFNRDKKSGKTSALQSSTLTDVLENRDIGTADWFGANDTFNQCQVNGAACNSPAEWHALAKPYMED
jgi:hypothetical protein